MNKDWNIANEIVDVIEKLVPQLMRVHSSADYYVNEGTGCSSGTILEKLKELLVLTEVY